MEKRAVAIGLGSNLGNRKSQILEAAERLKDILDEVRLSAIMESSPLDCPPDAGDYLNAVIIGKTDKKPNDLLRLCQAIEVAMGREPAGQRNYHSCRNIDIDLLMLGQEVIDSRSLTLPHPELHKRDFVLLPLAELAPDWQIPGVNKRVKDCLPALETNE